MRSGWKRGDHLVRDEESGFTEYASDCARDAYGVLKRKDQMDQRHPQEFIVARRDPYAVSPIAPPARDYDIVSSYVGTTVGTTSVAIVDGPASHIFKRGIGYYRIEYDFIVL